VGRQLLSELRRSPRIVARVPLVLISEGARVVSYSAVINRHGAMVLAAESYPRGAHVEMQNQNTKESVRCRVVWNGGETRPGLYKMGLEMLEDHPGFWGPDYSEQGPEEPV
jgi:hypothetical protein